jgi:hypothetical protein
MGFQKDRRGKLKTEAVKKAKKDAFERADWVGFLPCVLSDADKAAIDPDRLMETFGNVSDLEPLMAENYKLSFSLDRNNDAYVVSLTDQDAESEFGGYCLTGRGPTLVAAFCSLMYKHTIKLAAGWDLEVKATKDYS